MLSMRGAREYPRRLGEGSSEDRLTRSMNAMSRLPSPERAFISYVNCNPRQSCAWIRNSKLCEEFSPSETRNVNEIRNSSLEMVSYAVKMAH